MVEIQQASQYLKLRYQVLAEIGSFVKSEYDYSNLPQISV